MMQVVRGEDTAVCKITDGIFFFFLVLCSWANACDYLFVPQNSLISGINIAVINSRISYNVEKLTYMYQINMGGIHTKHAFTDRSNFCLQNTHPMVD